MKGATRKGTGKHSWYTVGKFDIIRQYTDNEHNGRWTVRGEGFVDAVSAFSLTAAVEFCKGVLAKQWAEHDAKQQAEFKSKWQNGYDAGRDL